MGGRESASPQTEAHAKEPGVDADPQRDNTSDTLDTDTSSAPGNSASEVPAGTTNTADFAETVADNATSFGQNARLLPIDTLNTALPRFHVRSPSAQTPRTPRDVGLHIETHSTNPTPIATAFKSSLSRAETIPQKEEEGSVRRDSTSNPLETPSQLGTSLRSTLSATSMRSAFAAASPGGSALNSPALNALTNITPLPSPIPTQESPKLWKSRSRPGSSGSLSRSLREEVLKDVAKTSPTKAKMKNYGVLTSPTNHGSPSHKSNRSISEFQPEPMTNERPRNVTMGTLASNASPMDVDADANLHREKYLAEQRGMIPPPMPTPPPSNLSVTDSEAGERAQKDDRDFVSYLTVREGPNGRRIEYRPVRRLGQGTFSSVVLATSEKLPPATRLDDDSESFLKPRNLVAIKVVQHGQAGGADEERVKLSLKREVEILEALEHPAIIHMQAFDWSDDQALIVLDYCPGGDLFELASEHRELLTPPIVQRMVAELVAAIRYMHSLGIVHRDIKLENVLLNMPCAALADVKDPFTRPHPLITITDLGLSRYIPKPPEDPMLQTRCGSEDYTAPEILLGQPYDGRKTDAWALGVLTYALMEGRLPFDPPPPRPGRRPIRSKPTHRIARCDWIWGEYGDEDGEWDPKLGEGWEGAKSIVESLLKKVTRGRATMDELAETEYVKSAIQVEGGISRAPPSDDVEGSLDKPY